MNYKKLQAILVEHAKWYDDNNKGIQANLSGADLRYANLSNTNLSSINFGGADLRRANLSYANLKNAYLRQTDLRHACLNGAKNIPGYVIASTNILPDGDLVGWKKCKYGALVKLLIPADARRSNATGRKCRAEYVKVLQILYADGNCAVGNYDDRTLYMVDQIVTCNKWNNNRWIECGGGIHFFITRYEAEHYERR